MKRPYLTDKDVMSVLMISRKTLAAIMKSGPNRQCNLDLRSVKPIIFGAGRKRGQRRWSVGKFASVTGLTREEIWEAIS